MHIGAGDILDTISCLDHGSQVLIRSFHIDVLYSEFVKLLTSSTGRLWDVGFDFFYHITNIAGGEFNND